MHKPKPEAADELSSGSHFFETRVLKTTWEAAGRNAWGLPRYEEVALGSLGRLSDETVLLKCDCERNYQVLRAGRCIERWIGRPFGGIQISDLASNYALPLGECIDRALDQSAPAFSLAHFVRDGMVSCYEMLALPLSTKSSDTLVLIFARERTTKYSLVEALFHASKAGLITLASMRHVANAIDFQVIGLNESASAVLDKGKDFLLWRRLSETLPSWVDDGCMDRLGVVLATGRSDEFETTYRRADGQILQLRVNAVPIGELLGVTVNDITEVKAREASFRLLFENNPLPMLLYDRETFGIIKVNEAALAHYGFKRDRFLAMRLNDLHPEAEWSSIEANRTFANLGNSKEHGWRHILADGRIIDVEIFAREQTLSGGAAVLVAIVDVTEQRAMQQRIAHIAHHDPLTDLPNRALLRQRLDQELSRLERQSSRLALFWLDLDQFKQVNDGLGHPVGDRLLCMAADRLRGILGVGDVAARIGGDEFAILMVDPSGPAQVNEFADRLIERLNEPYQIDGNGVICGCSIGISLAPNDGINAEDLLKKADIALYRAKKEGRGVHRFFQPEMDEQIEKRRTMVADLRRAVAARDFTLVYQPIVDLGAQRIISCEALLRWRHPVRGEISPAEFIPLAEETGLIAPLGDWVLKTACAEAAKWPGNVGIAINLSPIQFKNPHIVESVILALAQSGLSSHRLELEVTESVLLNESAANLATLHALRNIGAKISMDDFGTGYSSLSYLRTFPFDKIKLDRSFVSDLPDSAESLAIVRAIASLGKSLGLTILAEGVETIEQMQVLHAEGFAQAQGYLFARPQLADDIPGLIQIGGFAGLGRGAIFAANILRMDTVA